jgi:Tol biopolymer transport system component
MRWACFALAIGAMEVSDLTTKQMEPDVETRTGQEETQRNGNSSKRIGALAVGAAIIVGAVAFVLATRDGENEKTPANEPTTAARVNTSHLLIYDLETGETTPLAASLAGGFNYAVSPNGTKVAYGTCCSAADRITVANVDGSDANTLRLPKGVSHYGARWSPDGNALVYQEREGRAEDDVGDLFVHDFVHGPPPDYTERRTRLTDLKLKRAWWWFLFPSFSPDGKNVIFHLPRSGSEMTQWDVWEVRVSGGEPKLVLRNALFPMYFPDGKRIAFVSPSPSDLSGRSILVANAQGSRKTLVKAKDRIWWPTVSPDGSRIAYQDGQSIYVVDVATGETKRVTDGNTGEWLDNDSLIVAP